MNYTIEKNEQYALVRLAESAFESEIPTTFETLSRSLFREGYSNIIVDAASVETIDESGISAIRKVNRQCTNEEGLLILVTKNEDLIDEIDASNLGDLTILPTVEEAVDAVFMNELENDFRSESDDEFDTGSAFGHD
ncbi:STAS domain-containing protein [Spirosoma sp. KUDC1026]|uniref:STAS domain-containing protein n=1 Tax=Spirosoma sp. KUDC1026 TaxID=2745947 RepID=UPI00159BB296|nr:STAS domain-containing protein [Spirosoma sp. KUDC1026]QKZ15120.1 STAS domain-containing protein [Spirosoma sp. KUDC1026]